MILLRVREEKHCRLLNNQQSLLKKSAEFSFQCPAAHGKGIRSFQETDSQRTWISMGKGEEIPSPCTGSEKASVS